ncbi:MAG: choice-of-anchor J domain-containing protein [Saprospiraceae bacterium]|nr:choice-of-anchor J domain-containing protein [Candidatus Brachybacter algidus]
MLLVLLYPMQGLGNITNDDIQCASYVDNRIYVNYLANGANNGTSWADAFTNLQAALTAANTCPVAEIWVAKGIYYPDEGGSFANNDRNAAFTMRKAVAIYGGFVGDEAANYDLALRNFVTNETILSGDLDQNDGINFANNGGNAYHVIYNNTNGLRNDARLDGFTVSGGNANGSGTSDKLGGGMYGNLVSPTVINCVFTGNAAYNGGGMYIYAFYDRNNNETPSGVIYMKVSDCIFSGNKASEAGGGIFIYVVASMVFDNVVFSKNTATGNSAIGGGLFISDSRPNLSNVVFLQNIADRWGGAISTFGSSARISNGTFLSNSVTGTGSQDAGGISFSNDIVTNLYLLNCVFWNNRIGNNNVKSLGWDVNAIYAGNSNFQDLSTLAALHKTNCLDLDPLFVDPSDPDGPDNQWRNADDGLQLQCLSPVKNMGVSSIVLNSQTITAPIMDINGNNRVNEVDMGAYENQAVNITPTIMANGPTTFCSGGSVTLTSSEATGNQWYLAGNPIGGETNQTYIATASGSYTVVVSANGCSSAPSIATVVTVNPTPDVIVTPSSQIICSGASIDPIVLSSTFPGTVFNWTRDNNVAVTGIAASGTGSPISGSLTNTTNAPVTVNFTITPQSGGVTGSLINESFNTASGATMPAGWASQNLSNPIGSNTAGWNTFTSSPWAANTAPNHVGANFNCTTGNNTISAWLFAPNVNLNNGDVLTFYTRTNDVVAFADRLEVRMSTNGASINAGATNTSVGDFTTLLLTVNPTLNTSDYPVVFTQFSATLSGLPGAGVSGRIAFRYFVTNGGPSGINSDIISIDDVVLTTAAVTGPLCTGSAINATVTVNPTPVGSASPQTICGGTASNVALSSNVTGTTYTWTAAIQTAPSGGTITGFSNCAAACGTSIIQTLTNTGTTSGVVRYTVIPTANGCPGAPFTVDVTVDVCCPTIPTLTTNPSPAVCAGSNVILTASGLTTMNPNSYGITFKYFSAATATPYTGGTVLATIPNGSLTGGGTGATTTTSILPVGNNFIYAILSPTPTDVNCRPSATASIVVNPTPTYTFTSNGLPYSEGDTIKACIQDVLALAINSPVTATYTFTRLSNGNVISTGTTPASFNYTATNAREGFYEIGITSSFGCILKDTIYLQVNALPNPTATATPNPLCQGANLQLGVNGNNSFGFAWSGPNGFTANVKNPTITGITTAGTGVYMVTITNLNGCSDTSSISVLVNPTPNAVATPASQTICSAASISTIVLTGAVSGTTYAWTRDNAVAVTGIAASGSGNISGSLTNTTNAPVTVTFTITPTANSCPGAAITATVLVNPTPNAVATPAAQTICSASTISTIVLSGAVSGTTYAWTRNNAVAVTGIAASGTGNISGSLTNTTNAPITVTFTITPTASSCPGASITATVLVNPTPNAVATPASQTICSGAITTIALSGAVTGTTYAWTRDNTASAIGIAASGSGNISGSLTNTTNAPITVTFTITPTANSCPGAAITATVVINPTPSYTFTSNGLPYSEGDTITACNQDVLALAITSPVTVTYTFTRLSNGNVINTGSTPGSFNYTATNAREGFYEIGITNSFGCILKDTIYLLVNPLPNPVAEATPNPICQGGNLQLSVNGNNNFTFAWSGPNGFTSALKNPVINGITPVGSGIYTVTVTNLNGCSNTSTISVLVNPTPTAIATPAAQTICSASSISTIVLTGAVTGTTYAWTRNNTATVTGIAASGSGNISGTLTNTTSAPVTVTFTITPTANGCVGLPITATVLVNPTPNAVATPAAQTICSATSIATIVLTGNVTGTTYAWTRNNTATVTGIAASGSGNISGSLTNTTSAPITVTFTITPTANGCPGAAITATVLVNPTPTAVATPATQTICSEALITTITLSGPVIGTTFTWTRNNTVTVTGIAAFGSGNNIFGALTNTTSAPITVTFTITPSANGCIGTTTTATVIVNPKPIGTISIAPNPACVGSTVQLSASGGNTYSWSGPLGWTSSVQNPTILLTTHLQAGKYFVTVSNTYGCSVVLSSQLSVNYPPIATASYEQNTACTGSTLLLHGTGAGSYAWSGPNGFTSNQQNPQIPNVTVANSGLYILVVTSPNGCTATTTLNITINNPPALSANPTLTQTCEGSKIQLFASGTGSFVWNGPATYTSTDQNPVIQNIPIHMSGIYTVNLTASTGCVSTASVTVKVYDQIHAIATASEDTICQGQSLQLHAEGGSTYLWNGPNGFNSTESDPRIDNITPAASGKYYVYISNEGGCFGYAELTIVVKPSAKSFAYATPNPVNENSPVQFIASSNGVAYSWSGPLGFTSNQQNPFIKKVSRYMAGVYTVTITNENGCPSIVKVILRVLYTNKGGNTIDGDDDGLTTRSEATGTVYPNPTNDLLYFDTQSSEAIEYVIYDVNGKMQVVQKTTSDRYISTSQLSSGIYQIRWKSKDSDKWIVSKFVKIR